jgi:hypothetical protein
MTDIDALRARLDPISDASVEAVARAFCKRMGLDPDYGSGSWKQWLDYRARAREAIAMHLALKEVLG